MRTVRRRHNASMVAGSDRAERHALSTHPHLFPDARSPMALRAKVTSVCQMFGKPFLSGCRWPTNKHAAHRLSEWPIYKPIDCQNDHCGTGLYNCSHEECTRHGRQPAIRIFRHSMSTVMRNIGSYRTMVEMEGWMVEMSFVFLPSSCTPSKKSSSDGLLPRRCVSVIDAR